MMNYTRFFLLAWGLLSGCSAPETPTSTYPQNAAVSSPAGMPRDSATSYFPASAGVPISRDSLIRRLESCQFESRLTSKILFQFKAPVLSNYYLGHASYRLLWRRTFRLPVLLTLDLHESGGILKTQQVNRYPSQMASANEVAAESKPIIERINQAKKMIRAGQEVPANTEYLASSLVRLEDIQLSGTPLIVTDKVIVLSRDQIREFLALLAQANIWQLPLCTTGGYLDGVSYVFEAHEAQRYKVIGCSNPPMTGSFSKCCQFLLNLSLARAGEQN